MSIGKEELQQFYDEHKSQMERPEQIRLSELLVSTEKKDKNATADEADLAAAKAKAEDLLAQIRKGASFEEIAKKNSDGPTAAQGGDLDAVGLSVAVAALPPLGAGQDWLLLARKASAAAMRPARRASTVSS